MLAYAVNDPLRFIAGVDLFGMLQIGDFSGQYVGVLFGLGLFLYLVVTRISRYTKVIRDRMIAFVIFGRVVGSVEVHALHWTTFVFLFLIEYVIVVGVVGSVGGSRFAFADCVVLLMIEFVIIVRVVGGVGLAIS